MRASHGQPELGHGLDATVTAAGYRGLSRAIRLLVELAAPGTGALTGDYTNVTLKVRPNPGCDDFVQFMGLRPRLKSTYYNSASRRRCRPGQRSLRPH